MAINTSERAPMATEIGESILISGNLEGDEDLTVRGRVEGNVRLSRTLIVEASGVVKADVTVKNAIISGVVVGNVTATDSVQLTSEGRMVGDLAAPRVIIVDGASFRGRVDMGDVDAERPAGASPGTQTRTGTASRTAARPTTTARTTSAPAARAEPPRPATPPRPPVLPSAPPRPPLLAGAKRRVLVKKVKR
jgi:cytoskeletal protein CcmA (bactofilin family)